MKTVIGLTDTDQIRSVLGLTPSDAPDDLLLHRKLDVELRLDMATWIPDAATRYDASRLPTATQTEKDIAEALELFSAYFCAGLLARSGPLLVAQEIADGKNSLARFTPIAWDKIQSDMAAQAAKYKGIIEALIAATTDTATGGLSLFTTVGLAVDPVVDTGAVV